ncbi:TPA: hypothetical protein ACNIQM_002922 [Citrobacter werkmanii]
MSKNSVIRRESCRLNRAMFNVMNYGKNDAAFSDQQGTNLFGCEWSKLKLRFKVYITGDDSFEEVFLGIVEGKCNNKNLENSICEFKKIASQHMINDTLLEWCAGQREMMFMLHLLIEAYIFGMPPSLSKIDLPINVFDNKKGGIDKGRLIDLLDEMCFIKETFEVHEIIKNAERLWVEISRQEKYPLWFSERNYSEKYSEDYAWAISYFNYHSNINKVNGVYVSHQLMAYHICDLFLSNHGMRDAELRLFILKMKKAWSQKKYRDSVKGKVVLNTYLSTSAKQQLKIMADGHNKKLNEELETIINSAYMNYRHIR